MTAALAQAQTHSEDLVATPQRVGDAFELALTKIDGWVHEFFLLLPNLIVGAVVALIFVGLAWASSRLVHRTLMRADRHDLGYVLGRLAYWFILLLGFLVVMTIVLPSMHPVDIFASLGIGSIAIGFAFKDVLQNLLAGILILIRRPFKRGDQIKIGDIEGTVQAVETRATLVKTFNGRLVIIPNSDIYTRSVTVSTAYDIRRVEIVLPLGLEVDLAEACEVIHAALESVEDILEDPPPDVLPWEFANNNVNIVVRWWTKSQRTYEVRTRAQVIAAIKRKCEEAGIAIPSDTKISFAQPEFVVVNKKEREAPPKKPEPQRKVASPALTPDANSPADERRDPEAEKPKEGELNDGVAALPR